jgi:integrase
MPRVELTKSLLKSTSEKVNYYDTVEKGLIVRITENGTKSFCFRYKFNGKKRRFTFGRFPSMSLAMARTKVQTFRNNLLNGIDPQHKKEGRLNDLTFQELSEEFFKKHFPSLRESTKDKYRRIIKNDIYPHLKDLKINQINRLQILKIIDQKAFADNSPTHANNIRARLHTIFNFALKRGLVEKNPVRQTPKYRHGMNRRERFYSESEINEIWNFLQKLREPTEQIFKLLFLTGQRKRETKLMQWKNIDLKERLWVIPSDITKNKTTHHVPLSGMVVDILKYLKREYSTDSKYVFRTPFDHTTEDVPIKRIDASTRRIKNETTVSDFRPHDVRRTVATHLAKMRVRRTVVGKILNHKGLSGDSGVTAIYDRYSYEKEKREALETWAKKLKEIVG